MVTKSVPPAVSLGTHIVTSLTVVMKVGTPWVVGDLDGSVSVLAVVGTQGRVKKFLLSKLVD